MGVLEPRRLTLFPSLRTRILYYIKFFAKFDKVDYAQNVDYAKKMQGDSNQKMQGHSMLA